MANDKDVAKPNEAGDDEQPVASRGEWGGQLEFILTCIGYAVGLGNVWRFPYLTYRNGGGAFLIPFILMLFLIGIPLFFLELCFGQFASLGPIAIWRASPLFKGLGFAMVFTNLMVALYYNVIISWCLYYLFASMTGKLPWEYCENYWNTYLCMETEKYNATFGGNNDTFFLIEDFNGNIQNHTREDFRSPSDEYFYEKVLQISSGFDDTGVVVWQLALCLAMTWMLIFFVLIRGISSLGKVVYFTSTFPYILLTIMLIRGVTLEGAGDGIYFYLVPDFDKLGEMGVWVDAATQIFYALSTCTGGLIAMASYNQFKNNTLRDSLIVPIVNILTSIYAGFVIFSVLGYMAVKKGVEVKDVAASGPGLVFVVYPEGLSQMPVSPLWSILFFIMMMMLGLSSMFSMAETFFCAFMDEFPNVLRKTYYRTVMFRAVGCACFYLVSLPMVTQGGFYIFTIWDAYTGGFPLLVIGFIEILTIIYVYGYHNFADDISMMLGKKPSIVFRVAWSAVTPAVVFVIIIFTGINYAPPILFEGALREYVFPGGSQAVGWLIVGFCLLVIPGAFIHRMVSAVGWNIAKWTPSAMWQESRPLASWGPHDKRDRTGRYAPVGTATNGPPTTFTYGDDGADNKGFQPDEGGVTNNEGSPNVEMQTF